VRHLQLVSTENLSVTRSAIVCMKYVTDTKQLWVSTKEIPPTTTTRIVPPSSSLWQEVTSTTIIHLLAPQAVHAIQIHTTATTATLRGNMSASASASGTITTNNLSPSSQSKSDCLLFSLDGHQDVVKCIVPLPNGDVLTAGGRHDATTQIWSRVQLKEATTTAVATTATINNPPPIILATAATTTNLCGNDAGYVFAVAVLKDFKQQKSKDDDATHKNDKQPPQTGQRFAIAVARYNVVKIGI